MTRAQPRYIGVQPYAQYAVDAPHMAAPEPQANEDAARRMAAAVPGGVVKVRYETVTTGIKAAASRTFGPWFLADPSANAPDEPAEPVGEAS